MVIYHVVTPETWAAFDTDLYFAPSLYSEGFIHCSFAEQLDGVIRRYYAHYEKVIVVGIETDKLMSRVVKEPSTSNEIYPHVYGPLNRNAMISVIERTVENT
jgi:uncharacterized protein (DUF952 family)